MIDILSYHVNDTIWLISDFYLSRYNKLRSLRHNIEMVLALRLKLFAF